MTSDADRPTEPSSVDWGKFGLSTDNSLKNKLWKENESDYSAIPSNENELFHQDQVSSENKPWWKARLLLSEPTLFGTWDGVFTSCFINIFGVIVFMRSGWIVGEAGIWLSILIIVASVLVALTSLLSAIGICDRCQVGSGGVYFLVSHVLGARLGGAVGLAYCFGQGVAVSLYAAAFSESMTDLLHISDPWVDRGIAITLVLLLVVVNIAGVGWVIRLQFVLLIILLLAGLDFAVGSFVRISPENGVTGYLSVNFANNSNAGFTDDENWFTVFGVFFPTVTGVFAGINMSGDLRNPSKDIPVGSLAAVGSSTFLYLMFVLILGATCERDALLTNFMIAEKVSALKVLLLAGLYTSSMSSCIATLYGTPRVLQSMANENVIPFIKILGVGRGPNKVPVFALGVMCFISLVFIMIGQINTLAPIVSMPFLFTYAAVDYAYFSLAMSFNMQKKRDARFSSRRSSGVTSVDSATFTQKDKLTHSGSNGISYGSTTHKDQCSDLDELFPERLKSKQGSAGVTQQARRLPRQQSSVVTDDSGADSTVTSPDDHSSIRSVNSTDNLRNLKEKDSSRPVDDSKKQLPEITSKPRSWYGIFCNRWLSICGAVINLLIMFMVQWLYAILCILTIFIIYIYIGRTNPGVFPGIAEFHLFPWLKNGILRLIGRSPTDYDQIIVTPSHPGVEVMAAQITEDNEDYAARERYHQSSLVKPTTGFHDYQVDD